MGTLSRQTRQQHLIEDVRTVLTGRTWPESVLGYDVDFGEFDGEPAMWVRFRVKEAGSSATDRETEADRLNGFAQDVVSELVANIDDVWPYVHFDNVRTESSAAT